MGRMLRCWAVVLCCAGSGVSMAEDIPIKTGLCVGMNLNYRGTVERHQPAYGAQVVAPITESFSLELSVTRLSNPDEETRLQVTLDAYNADMTATALAARYAFSLPVEGLRLYGLGGLLYNSYDNADVRTSGLESHPGVMRLVSRQIEARMDDAWGPLVGAGLEWGMGKRVDFFLEYRYSFVHPHSRISGVTSDTVAGQAALRSIEQDLGENSELGLIRMGLSWAF